MFTILIAWRLFSDRPGPGAIVAGGLIVAAAAVAGAPGAIDPALLPYLFLALCAPFGFGFAGSGLVHKLHAISPPARIASVSIGAVLGLSP